MLTACSWDRISVEEESKNSRHLEDRKGGQSHVVQGYLAR